MDVDKEILNMERCIELGLGPTKPEHNWLSLEADVEFLKKLFRSFEDALKRGDDLEDTVDKVYAWMNVQHVPNIIHGVYADYSIKLARQYFTDTLMKKFIVDPVYSAAIKRIFNIKKIGMNPTVHIDPNDMYQIVAHGYIEEEQYENFKYWIADKIRE